MFFNWKNKHSEERILVGDLDALRRKSYVIIFQGKEWRCPDLTIRQYAEFCALLEQVEGLSNLKTEEGIRKTEKAYDSLFRLCIPDLPYRLRKNLTMLDATSLFVAILERHGVIAEKKKMGPLSPGLPPVSPNS